MSYKIIQISDCHLLADEKEQHYGAVPGQQMQALNSVASQADYIMVTGDLVHDASSEIGRAHV